MILCSTYPSSILHAYLMIIPPGWATLTRPYHPTIKKLPKTNLLRTPSKLSPLMLTSKTSFNPNLKKLSQLNELIPNVHSPTKITPPTHQIQRNKSSRWKINKFSNQSKSKWTKSVRKTSTKQKKKNNWIKGKKNSNRKIINPNKKEDLNVMNNSNVYKC